MSSESKRVQVDQGRSQHVTRSESVATWWLEVELDVDHAPPNVEVGSLTRTTTSSTLDSRTRCVNTFWDHESNHFLPWTASTNTRRLGTLAGCPQSLTLTRSERESTTSGTSSPLRYATWRPIIIIVHEISTSMHCVAEQFGDRSHAAPMDLSSLTGITTKRAAASATLLETDHLTGMASPAGLSSGEQSAWRLRGPASPDFLRDWTNPLMMTYFILGFCGNCKEEVRHFPAQNYRINLPRDGDLDLATFGLDVQFGHNGRATRDRGYCTLTEPRRFLRCARVPCHS
ncbi:hypothetical protein CPB85DRAFT_1460909 [Mucidula mucida]|nr:hypothetical protein CPB85DRAFT_1460909 [Mucidula mucida]